MLQQSAFALGLAYAMLGVLCFLCLVRLRSILASRFTDAAGFRAAFPSWAASAFGLSAIISLGLVFPLEDIDALVGGDNNANLLQSILTVCSFWFFREAVVEVVFAGRRRVSRWLLLGSLMAFSLPFFFFIRDRGPTSSSFMSTHAGQWTNVVYNVVYMAVIAWIVVDMIWMLRQQRRGAYFVFVTGLAVVLLAAVDEIVYALAAHLMPGGFSDATYQAFYVLFFGGILIVGLGWLWVLIAERDYLGRLRLRACSLGLIWILWRVRGRGARTVDDNVVRQVGAPNKTSAARRVAPGPSRGPRLRVDRYRSWRPPSGSPTPVLRSESQWNAVLGLLGSSAEDVAYRLVVQVRNVVVRHSAPLASAEERLLVRVESRYPGFGPEGPR
ncbi:hypothetical protein DZF92_05145 [Clavibacter michiganensis subsp. insidiosus]|uniref:Uncharacterized protein n=1 Tax=Clavibacter michiganensis subsp. insidiosus TaxID=33014 RepID=A0A399SP32_9MICO|nr:hypothetical protein [Clavibacter michiganensis]OQJ58631.1 hypothetical protein B5P21_00985 [Clavibacter michiganensis subsp. insidiosus]RII87902.1 hypothetical protein DZF92_05145 [Clavibacter michiganensis subsp. insidiosus]RIJ44724.1 hypothetical protein DZF93_01750 [Clavibacter michiganensis subsp. insidiosus]RMC83486.1 hypothetical protein CmiCFBP2404_14955 [Clavibacter michiganensis subsp. insidiosus]